MYVRKSCKEGDLGTCIRFSYPFVYLFICKSVFCTFERADLDDGLTYGLLQHLRSLLRGRNFGHTLCAAYIFDVYCAGGLMRGFLERPG